MIQNLYKYLKRLVIHHYNLIYLKLAIHLYKITAKDLVNHWTDMDLLYTEASYRAPTPFQENFLKEYATHF